MGRKKPARKGKDTSKQQEHSETVSSIDTQAQEEVDTGAGEVEVKSKPISSTVTMQQAASPVCPPNGGRDIVLTTLERIYSRFRQTGEMPHDKLLPEEYAAIGVILGGIDHAVLALKETRKLPNLAAIPPYLALSVIIDGGDQDVFLNTASRPLIYSKIPTMQMFYQPPFNEGGPSSNYSLVWIFKPKFESNFIPFINGGGGLQGSSVREGHAELQIGSGISRTTPPYCEDIEEGKPYTVSNFIAQKAFLQVTSSGRADSLDIEFTDRGKESADIYFKLEKPFSRDLKWAMWTVYNDKPYYLLPLKVSVKGNDDRRIYASLMVKQDTAEMGETKPPPNAFVWRFHKNFKVNCSQPISPEDKNPQEWL